MVTRERWLAGFGLVVGTAVILSHAAFPRYELHDDDGHMIVRFDRWTGNVERSEPRYQQSWDSIPRFDPSLVAAHGAGPTNPWLIKAPAPRDPILEPLARAGSTEAKPPEPDPFLDAALRPKRQDTGEGIVPTLRRMIDAGEPTARLEDAFQAWKRKHPNDPALWDAAVMMLPHATRTKNQ